VPRSWDIAAELRDQCLNQEIFYSLMEAQVVVEHWRNEYNAIRPHSSLGYRPPAPQATERRRTVARSAIPARK
jgi:putative transposase